jgi:anti-sigma factor RsiW
MRCNDATTRLAGYLDGVLPAREHREVDAHLAECDGCRREEAALRRSLDALSAVARAPRSLETADAPDLWAAFTTRLASTLPCARVDELLPAYRDRELPRTDADAVRYHLAGCPACAAQAALLKHSLRTLEAVGAACPPVDLWPAFSERLERERGRRWRMPDFAGLLRTPSLRPALMLGSLALVLLAARGVLAPTGGPQTAMRPHRAVQSPTHMAKVTSPEPPRAAETAVGKPLAHRVRRHHLLTVRWERRRVRRAAPETRMASATPLPQPVRVVTPKESVPAPKPWSEIQVAYNPTPFTPTESFTVTQASSEEVNSPGAQAKVINEFMHVAEGLAGIQDAAKSPLGTSGDAK